QRDAARDREAAEDEEDDLPRAPRPLALHLAGRGVDHDAEGLLLEPVAREPDRQQHVLVGEPGPGGLDAVDPLRVAADAAADVGLELGADALLRRLEAA